LKHFTKGKLGHIEFVIRLWSYPFASRLVLQGRGGAASEPEHQAWTSTDHFNKTDETFITIQIVTGTILQ
jgi:hypothetical protein